MLQGLQSSQPSSSCRCSGSGYTGTHYHSYHTSGAALGDHPVSGPSRCRFRLPKLPNTPGFDLGHFTGCLALELCTRLLHTHQRHQVTAHTV